MSGGGGPPYYGFTGGNPYYTPPNAPPTHFPNAPFPGAPPAPYPSHSTFPSAPQSFIHPPTHFSLTSSYPTGETHFTSTSITQSNTSFAPVTSGPRWVHWHGGVMIPAQAVEAGYDIDGSKIYVGRLHHKGDLIPAKVVPQRNIAYAPYDGRETSSPSCEVLCMNYAHWIKSSHGRVPPGAIPVGRTNTGETLYTARVHHKGSLTIGKVHPSHNVCYISFGGKEIPFHEYEVLTA